MNRSLPALILLLGTLGGSIVALGVARDLERVSRRLAIESHSASTVASGAFCQGRIVPNVSIRQDWLRDVATTVHPPLRYEDEIDYVAGAIDLLEQTSLREATEIVDRSTEWLSRASAVDTTPIDSLIADNDGVIEKTERDRVPHGYVAIGPDRTLVAVQHRGDVFTGTLLWTGSLHYGGNARQTLGSTAATTMTVAQPAQPLPWDELVLWGSDRREWAARIDRGLQGLLSAGVASIESAGLVGDAVTWADGHVNRSWNRLAIHIKRELWLVTVPYSPAPMRSAELPQGDKR